MAKIRALLLLLPLLCGCEQDYHIAVDGDYKPKVVVNSVISPDGPVTLELFWSRQFNDTEEFRKVEAFTLTLYEGEQIVLQSTAYTGGMANTGFTPKEGESYRIEIEVPEYGTVSAQTTIPDQPSADCEYVREKGYYRHFVVNSIEPDPDCLSHWVFLRNDFEGGYNHYASELYSINPYADQINAVLDSWEADEKESNVGFEHFIRIPRRNLKGALPVTFSVSASDSTYPVDDWDNLPVDQYGNYILPDPVPLTHVTIEIVAPSDDFDRYFKTLYKQREYSRYDGSVPFMFETVHVHTNITNGLGIFAGYSKKAIVYAAYSL